MARRRAQDDLQLRRFAMYVIAGASGRTGKVVAETLLSQGKQVRVVVRDGAKASALRARGAEVAVASLDDEAALERALQGAAGFYTLLPEDLGAGAEFHAHRSRMADAMAAAARASRVPHVVFLSGTPAALPDGNGPAKDVHYAENALRAAAAKLTILRASFFQENVFMALTPAKHEGIYPNFHPAADFAFATVATRDIGKLAARSLCEPPSRGEIVDLLGPEYSVRDLASGLGRALGKTLRVVDISPAAQVGVLTQAGLPAPYAEALVEMFACFAPGRIPLRGDRTERCTTTLDEVLRDGLAT
jgi:uncharacterized protein YbjT (DUF2867 family)